ncbi:MAG TPA: HemK2/MTQ2 family protein methyltransferase [archaeon]|nr:HemK2/MTQ2 family protein methyltransferase [archaeon]
MKKYFLKSKELYLFDSVYEPREDSFLLAESVSIKKGSSVLDLGTGSGIQGINALLLGAGKVTASDINSEALKNFSMNAEKLGFKNFECIESNLFEKIRGKFDAIIFNPPYIPAEKIKFIDLDGGKKGREVLDGFLEKFDEYLNEGGVCFFLQTDLNGAAETEKILKKKNLKFEIIARKKLFFEELLVFRVEK